MFNLIVSGNCKAWKGKTFDLDEDRCIKLNEYTRNELYERFGKLSKDNLEQLKNFPCIFAYETSCGELPRFGWFKSIKKRADRIIFECEYVSLDPWLDGEEFSEMERNLDIYGLEMNRTHWAVKDVDLGDELAPMGITIPTTCSSLFPVVDIDSHQFDVAFSFPGEVRKYVERVVVALQQRIEPERIFYDNFYQPYLARPSLDLLLKNIYKDRSKLLVVFLSENYDRKPWPGIEFKAIREIMFEKNQDHRVMYIRMDDAEVAGVSQMDGYIDARDRSPAEVANFVFQRIQSLRLLSGEWK